MMISSKNYYVIEVTDKLGKFVKITPSALHKSERDEFVRLIGIYPDYITAAKYVQQLYRENAFFFDQFYVGIPSHINIPVLHDTFFLIERKSPSSASVYIVSQNPELQSTKEDEIRFLGEFLSEKDAFNAIPLPRFVPPKEFHHCRLQTI